MTLDTRPIQSGTNRRLHALLTQAGLNNEEDKASLVHTYTGNRTEHSSQMHEHEAITMINALKALLVTQEQSADLMRKKILAICHTMQWYGKAADGSFYMHEGRPVLDWERINNFCINNGPFKKRLQQHTAKELTVLVTIFEKIKETAK